MEISRDMMIEGARGGGFLNVERAVEKFNICGNGGKLREAVENFGGSAKNCGRITLAFLEKITYT